MSYLNPQEIESKLEILSLTYPSCCSLVELPEPTHEGFVSHALRIRAGELDPRPGVLLIGGVHAREWGSSDTLMFFAEQLLSAYSSGAGIVLGGRTVPADSVRQLAESVDVFLFPDVNPDGRAYSQTIDRMWRSNRAPIPGSTYVGVNINRNYDFLWDYKKYFLHQGEGAEISDEAWSTNFRGLAPFSEPETRNVKWLFDTYPWIQYFVDVHSYGEVLAYPWGDDRNQHSRCDQRFDNPTYDGMRGCRYCCEDGYEDAIYGEFILQHEDLLFQRIGKRMKDAIFGVRQKSYSVCQSCLCPLLYPLAGDSIDYSLSRYRVDTHKARILPFLIEWGPFLPYDADQAYGFQPNYDEMSLIMRDVSAGLVEFCLAAGEADVYFRDTLEDVGNLTPASVEGLESPDIVVRAGSEGPVSAGSMDLWQALQGDGFVPSVAIVPGFDYWVYVRFRNRGGRPVSHNGKLHLSTAEELGNPTAWSLLYSWDGEWAQKLEPNGVDALAWHWTQLPAEGLYYLIATEKGFELGPIVGDCVAAAIRFSNKIVAKLTAVGTPFSIRVAPSTATASAGATVSYYVQIGADPLFTRTIQLEAVVRKATAPQVTRTFQLGSAAPPYPKTVSVPVVMPDSIPAEYLGRYTLGVRGRAVVGGASYSAMGGGELTLV